jgi:hypothetical protein
MLILKLTIVPVLIALITLAGRRWGAHIAGWLSAFPVVGGPILFFIAMERGVDFASVSALGMFSSIAANIFFGIAYAWLATRLNWFFTLMLALVIYAFAVLLINSFALTIWQALFINLVVMLLAPRLFPKAKILDKPLKHSPVELPLRMIAGAILVFAVTFFSEKLGSRLSGMMAMFPVMASVLAVFSHRNAGKDFAIQLLRGALLGWYAFSAFSLLLAVFLPTAGIAKAFVLALVAALLVQAVTLRFIKKLQDELELLE